MANSLWKGLATIAVSIKSSLIYALANTQHIVQVCVRLKINSHIKVDVPMMLNPIKNSQL